MILKMESRYNVRIVTVECDRKRCRCRQMLKGPINQTTRQIMESEGWQMGTVKDPTRDICPTCKKKGLQ